MPPTEKQIRYAWFLHKQTKLPLPGGWAKNQQACGLYIVLARSQLGTKDHEYRHHGFSDQIAKLPAWAKKWCAQSKYVDADIIRILGGGPLKNDPGPWDEEWCRAQEVEAESVQLDFIQLTELRAKGL